MKGLIGFIFGVAAGSVVTYFMTKSKIERQCQEDIEEMKKSVVSNVIKEEIVEDVADDVDKVEDKLPEKIEEDKPVPTKTNYRNVELSKKDLDFSGMERPDFDISAEEGAVKVKKRKKYETKEIDAEEYNELLNDDIWDCMFVEWDAPNHKLMDEDDNEVSVEDVGYDILLNFEANFEPGETIYVANYDLEIAYELTLR